MKRPLSPREAGERERLQVWMRADLKAAIEKLAEDDDTTASELLRQQAIDLLRRRGRYPGGQRA